MYTDNQKYCLFGGLSFSLLIFLFMLFLLSFCGFVFHKSISVFYALFSFFAGIISLFFYFKNISKKYCPRKFRDKPNEMRCERNFGVVTLKSEHFAGGVDTAAECETRLDILTAVVLYILFIFSAFCLGSFFFDSSWDGRTYHQAGVVILSKGWNPVYDDIYSFCLNLYNSYPRHLICVDNYPKFVEIIQANIYLIFKNIEAAKMTALLSAIILFCYSFFILNKIYFHNISLVYKFLLSFVITLNPVFITQFTTFYSDGYVYIYFAIMLFSIIDIETQTKRPCIPILMLIMSSVCLFNVKLGGILCVLTTYFVYLIYLCTKKDRKKIINLLQAVFITAVLALISGINPYFTNISHNRHPFHPLAGNYKVDFMTSTTPDAFLGHNRFRNLFISTFSKVKNQNKESAKFELKLPFSIHKSELQYLQCTDNRFCGFGILWSGILLLAFVFLMFIKYEKNAENELNILVFTILTSLLLINPYGWWARYVPYFWLIPVFICILLCMKANKTIYERILIYCLLILMLSNSLIQTYFVIKESINYKNYVNSFFNSIKKHNNTINIFNIYDWSFVAKFQDKAIPVQYVSSEYYFKNKTDFKPIPIALDNVTIWDYKE